VFELASATDASWAPRVVNDLPDLLVDHAHCEKKAAGMAINLIFRYPDHAFLLEPLSRLAREELAHFEEVLRLMAARGIAFRALKPAPYAGKLKKQARTYEPARLLDTLLFGALIEARSCERFQHLAEAGPDPGLRHFYAGLLAAEARHRRVYLDLALLLGGEEEVAERFPVLAAHEAQVLANSPPLPRMHAA
jgi:tRNA-(ms[2]io[6]A)-hydroxylase